MVTKDKEKIREAAKRYAQSEKGRAKVQAYREANKAKIAARVKAWAEVNKERVIAKGKKWASANPERLAIKWKKSADRLRMDILKHYGGDPPSCACCGEGAIQFLAIDHINGDGNTHRKSLLASGEISSLGKSFHTWLRKNGYPEGFRILCHNCNMALGCYGECPHTQELLTVESLYRSAVRLKVIA